MKRITVLAAVLATLIAAPAAADDLEHVEHPYIRQASVYNAANAVCDLDTFDRVRILRCRWPPRNST